MAIGYSRQSIADIIPTEVVRAGPINAEFDALLATSNATTGHNHNGTAGGGAKIDLVNSVDTSTKLPLAYGGTNADLSTASTDSTIIKGASALTYRRNNFTAVVAPVVTDDSNSGYGVGSFWNNTVTSVLYVCALATVGAASWVNVVSSATSTFPATSNLGMGGFVFTNLGAGASAGQSLRFEQLGPVKVTTNDTTSKFLDTAITVSGSLTKTLVNPGANETLDLSVTVPAAVTSVAQSFTGGLISVSGSPITTSGTLALTVAGTSGGIPYFGSSSTWASSAALTQYGIVYGGGAGASPVATSAGTTGQVLIGTTSAAPSWIAAGTTGQVLTATTSAAPSFQTLPAPIVPAGAIIYTALNFGGF